MQLVDSLHQQCLQIASWALELIPCSAAAPRQWLSLMGALSCVHFCPVWNSSSDSLCSRVSLGLSWGFPCPILLPLPLYFRYQIFITVSRLSLPHATLSPFIFHRLHFPINLSHSYLHPQSLFPREAVLSIYTILWADILSSLRHDGEILLTWMHSASYSNCSLSEMPPEESHWILMLFMQKCHLMGVARPENGVF